MADKNSIPQFVNSESFMADKNYVNWLSDLKKRFRMSPNYYSRVDFTPAALKEKLLAKIPSADLSGDKKSWLKDPIRDSAGSVETVEVGGVTVRGGTVRAALGLRSACFEWGLQDGNFVFYVTGYGHGVGLSQYGADAMAESGADYQTILTHYYTGVTVEVFTG